MRLFLSRLVGILLALACSASGQVSFARDVPLTLNLLNPDRSIDHALRPYMIGLRRSIQAEWNMSVGRPLPRRCRAMFEIGRDGTLLHLYVEKSSGDHEFDQAALNAIAELAPFNAPPAGAYRALRILATFDGRYVRQVIGYGRGDVEQHWASRYSRSWTERTDTHHYAGLLTKELPRPSAAQAESTEGPPEFQPRAMVRPDSRQPTPPTDVGMQGGNSGSDVTTDSPEPVSSHDVSAGGGFPVDSKTFCLRRQRDINALSEDERSRYLELLSHWLQLPPHMRFGFEFRLPRNTLHKTEAIRRLQTKQAKVRR